MKGKKKLENKRIPNILKSKKGGIPAINEIVMTFLNITPKPILILIFLLLLVTISGFVIPIFLNLFGYYCVNHQDSLDLYQVPANNLLQKSFYDVQKGVEGILGVEQYQLPDDPFPDGNKEFLRIPAECFIESTANGTTVSGYVSACTDCPTNANFFEGFYKFKSDLICTDDGYFKKAGLLDRKLCAQCSPPNPYYYNHSNCVNQDECYFTITNTSLIPAITTDYLDQVNYQKIVDLGGVLRQQNSENIVNIQCSAVGKPNLYFFSIELFNQTMWVLIVIGYFLTIFAWGWYGVVLK